MLCLVQLVLDANSQIFDVSCSNVARDAWLVSSGAQSLAPFRATSGSHGRGKIHTWGGFRAHFHAIDHTLNNRWDRLDIDTFLLAVWRVLALSDADHVREEPLVIFALKAVANMSGTGPHIRDQLRRV